MEKTKVAEAVTEATTEQAATQQEDPRITIRRAMTENYLQHCVNARATDDTLEPHQVLMMGAMDAVCELVAAILGVSEEGQDQRIGWICQALGAIGVKRGNSGVALPALMMQEWAVAQARAGKFNSLVGAMADAVEEDKMAYIIDRMNGLTAPAAVPPAELPADQVPAPAPAPAEAESSAPESHDEVEPAPKNAAPVEEAVYPEVAAE